VLRPLFSAQPAGFLFLLFFVAAFSVEPLLHPMPVEEFSLLQQYGIHFPVAEQIPPVVFTVLYGLFLLTIGFVVSYSAMIARFTHHLSLLPTFVFYALGMLAPVAVPHITSLFFVLIAVLLLQQIARVYNRQRADSLLLNAGLLFGLLTLLELQWLLALPVLFIMIARLRNLQWRESIVVLSGVVVVHFLTATALLWLQGWPAVVARYDVQLFRTDWPELSWVEIAQLAIVAVLVAAAYLTLLGKLSSQIIQFRRNFSIWNILFLTATALWIISGTAYPAYSGTVLAMAAAFLAWWWQFSVQQERATIWVLTLAGLVFVFQYINFGA
jgi:hypothetical protein